jgi:hypothetical protein
MASTSSPERLLSQWFPHTTTPFIANAPMLGFTDSRFAGAVTRAGGLGMYTPLQITPSTKPRSLWSCRIKPALSL